MGWSEFKAVGKSEFTISSLKHYVGTSEYDVSNYKQITIGKVVSDMVATESLYIYGDDTVLYQDNSISTTVTNITVDITNYSKLKIRIGGSSTNYVTLENVVFS